MRAEGEAIQVVDDCGSVRTGLLRRFAPRNDGLRLPDHLHIVMTLPPDDANFSTRLSLIKRRFTTALVQAGVQIARHQNGEFALWQRRFWEHTIRDDMDFERHVDYIHFNPVKHGLVVK